MSFGYRLHARELLERQLEQELREVKSCRAIGLAGVVPEREERKRDREASSWRT